ncbi:MAG: glycoside hydrolase family 88 protein [Verrucomicrobia bacterium]|nr:glycoside hydrolase family 88 protein [Verrucomicrobiota bacterium]
MKTMTLESPVGSYQPQVLLMAPESGEDAHTLSLASQFFELGVPIELDEQWRAPTSPPKDLSAYKTCLVPASSKPRYDRDLDAFARRGGYLYRKYYPDAPDTSGIAIPHLIAYGRDVYFYGFAQACLTAGLTLNDPDFLAALRQRSHASLLNVYRQRIAEQDGAQNGPLPNWGDRIYTRNCDDTTLARFTGDPFWENTSRRFLERLRDSVDEVMDSSSDRIPPGRHLVMDYEGTSSHNPAMMGAVLMRHGQRLHDPSLTQAGVRVGTAYVRMSRVENNVVHQQRFHGNSVSELMCGVEVLCWLASVTGEVSWRKMAEATFRDTVEPCQNEEGLWHHVVSSRGRSACWSRATQWPVLWGTHALEAIADDWALGEKIRSCLERTYVVLERHQDPKRGLWRLVMNEPESRLESSATAALVYCHDRLREMAVLDDRHAPMIERAFEGLKTVYYGGGLGDCCRGTTHVSDPQSDYYRTRPLGWYEGSLFAGALASRMKSE